jgi:peptidoglycan L-alanyl-D-glutamate endopeptidase CwlK
MGDLKMASRKIEDLHPELIPLWKQFLSDCKDAGITPLITCTYRSNAEQDSIYAQGRTKPGPIVTRAKGGQSDHNYTINGSPKSKAFDIVPLVNGKCVWNESDVAWTQIINVWKSLKPINGYQLDWYGRKGAPFSEFCHFCLIKALK